MRGGSATDDENCYDSGKSFRYTRCGGQEQMRKPASMDYRIYEYELFCGAFFVILTNAHNCQIDDSIF
jgi:hypothetical protein